MTMADTLDTTNPTRRTILGSGFAAAGALVALSVPAVAASERSDAKLLQLCRNYLHLERVHERLCRASDRAEEDQRNSRQKPPPRPEALTGTLDVWPDACGPFGRVFLKHPLFERKELSEVADGTATIQAWCLKSRDRDDNSRVYAPEAARAKAKELLAIYDDWVAKGGVPRPDSQRRSPVEVKIDTALARLSKMQEATAEAIAELPAHTMAGIRAKLHVTTSNPDYVDGRDQFGSDYPPLIAIGASAMRDIERIDLSARLHPPSLRKALVASLEVSRLKGEDK
jgi:hypothetical protein